MGAHDLLNEARGRGFDLTAVGDQVRVRPLPPPAFMARLAAAKAELLAILQSRPVIEFRLPGHPCNAWATALGRPGQSFLDLQADLRRQWPGVLYRSPKNILPASASREGVTSVTPIESTRTA